MRQRVSGVWFAVCMLALVAVAVGGVAISGVAASGESAQDGATAEKASFGSEVSSFMQASTAEANSNVESEMFQTALNRTDDPAERRALVKERQERLAERQQRLRERRADIDGENATVRDRALAARVAVGATNLQRSVNGTERAGLRTDRLAEIRSNARQLRGPEVAALARGLAGSRTNRTLGPPAGVLGANLTDVPELPTNRSGPDGAAPGQTRNGSDERGSNGTTSGERDPPDDSGGGSDGPQSDDVGDEPQDGDDRNDRSGENRDGGDDSSDGNDNSGGSDEDRGGSGSDEDGGRSDGGG